MELGIKDWYSHNARRQDSKGVTPNFRRRLERNEDGSGELLASKMGVYVSRLVTSSVTLPSELFEVEAATTLRVLVSGPSLVGTLDFSREMMKSWVVRSANM